jgi:GT2 family glycosyltransferase/glycosyltransferase involved in cell wall biosynthesis
MMLENISNNNQINCNLQKDLRNMRVYFNYNKVHPMDIYDELSMKKFTSLEMLRLFHDKNFINFAYRIKLKREPCKEEVDYYLTKIRTTLSPREIINELSDSNNAKKKAHQQYFNFSSVIINFPISKNPVVSVVIPIYGKIEYTMRCLESISKNIPQTSFEIIVVDDCSPDNSIEIIEKINGVNLIKNSENQGFIRSCNLGAKSALGDYICFLNNDTEVHENWLDELVRTFNEFPGTGLVGSKLVYPDGQLQEAGGIIWQDGSAWNFGRFQDPMLPVYNYAREVDYCSGASIMVPKALFNELGGFDEHYLPAYCEDSDLALKIRDKGYRVIYQPLSTVIHFEGITSGTDTTQGTKAYQVENSKKLFERWQHRLQTHQAPGTDVDNAKDRRATRRVLVLDHCTPTPNQDAGSVTTFNIMLLLREMDFQVTFIPESNFLYMPEYTTALQHAGIEVLYAPYVTTVDQHLNEYGQRYDLAFLFRPGVIERHLKTIRNYCTKTKVLFHTVDLHFLRMSREAELQSDKAKQKAADEMKQRELAAIRAVDASIVHSTAELDLLRPLLPDAKLHVYPLILDIKGTNKSFAERRDIIFVGGYQHTPNVDAVQYFVAEIMPLLRKKIPGVRFYAVGSNPPAEIHALASADVIITGFVEDLTPLLDKMCVAVAPLRYGAGIKGKIGTAMAVGLPMVATSLAAEGMSLTDGENILVADGAEAFANAVAKIYQDEALWYRISQNSLAFADKAWGAETAYRTLDSILNSVAMSSSGGSYALRLYRTGTVNAYRQEADFYTFQTLNKEIL